MGFMFALCAKKRRGSNKHETFKRAICKHSNSSSKGTEKEEKIK